jgi:hypothetical protein
VKDGELWLLNAHISPYQHGNIFNHDPWRWPRANSCGISGKRNAGAPPTAKPGKPSGVSGSSAGPEPAPTPLHRKGRKGGRRKSRAGRACLFISAVFSSAQPCLWNR